MSITFTSFFSPPLALPQVDFTHLPIGSHVLLSLLLPAPPSLGLFHGTTHFTLKMEAARPSDT